MYPLTEWSYSSHWKAECCYPSLSLPKQTLSGGICWSGQATFSIMSLAQHHAVLQPLPLLLRQALGTARRMQPTNQARGRVALIHSPRPQINGEQGGCPALTGQWGGGTITGGHAWTHSYIWPLPTLVVPMLKMALFNTLESHNHRWEINHIIESKSYIRSWFLQ